LELETKPSSDRDGRRRRPRPKPEEPFFRTTSSRSRDSTTTRTSTLSAHKSPHTTSTTATATATLTDTTTKDPSAFSAATNSNSSESSFAHFLFDSLVSRCTGGALDNVIFTCDNKDANDISNGSDNDINDNTAPPNLCANTSFDFVDEQYNYNYLHHPSMDLPGAQPPVGLPNNNNNNSNSNANNTAADVQQKARRFAGSLAASAGRTVQQWTVRKYTLPGKDVASQVLMYRQLLHTKCRPGLKLSREYQATAVQQAVKHMPWWSEGMEESGRMVISYDNLIRRLWLDGAMLVHLHYDDTAAGDTSTSSADLDTMLDADGLPPVPHPYWVDRLGFQQPDPVTDFRSGGVLSLALMAHVVESCPAVFTRYVRPTGDACVLPFGITSINITDMIAKFLMFAKSVDRMDALLSQKPFWNMFADPNAILVCKELSMDMLADVVVELRTERELYNTLQQQQQQQQQQQESTENTNETSTNTINTSNEKKKDLVTVFDFAHILERTERRVEDDLLGAGPQSVQELRVIHGRLKTKYSAQLEVRLHKLAGTTPGAGTAAAAGTSPGSNTEAPTASTASPGFSKAQVLQHATGLASGASAFAGNAGNWFAKMTSPGFSPVKTAQVSQSQPTPSYAPTMVTIPRTPIGASTAATTDFLCPTPTNAATPEPSTTPPTPVLSAIPSEATLPESPAAAAPANMTDADSDGDWCGTDIASATEQVSNFSITGDDEDDDFL
jgi:hypothetical protein